jgi:hypothetical protein
MNEFRWSAVSRRFLATRTMYHTARYRGTSGRNI